MRCRDQIFSERHVRFNSLATSAVLQPLIAHRQSGAINGSIAAAPTPLERRLLVMLPIRYHLLIHVPNDSASSPTKNNLQAT
eukprot:697226-Pleurochrysis_carterae.AAC.2